MFEVLPYALRSFADSKRTLMLKLPIHKGRQLFGNILLPLSVLPYQGTDTNHEKGGSETVKSTVAFSNFWKGVWKHYLRAKLFFLIILHRGEPYLCRFLNGAIKWVEMGNYWRLNRLAEVECRKIVREQILFPLLEEQGRKGEVAKGGSKAASVSTGKNLESRRLRSDCVFILIHVLMQDCCQGRENIHIFVYCLVPSTVSVHKVSTTTVFAQQAACISPPRLSHSLSPSPPFEKLLPSSSL